MSALVQSVCAREGHHFSKAVQPSIELVAGMGVAHDAHMGVLVKHRSRARKHPDMPNLRQVHLIDSHYVALMQQRGFMLNPGDIGENIVIDGIDLIALPRDCRLDLGNGGAIIRVTGLRNPCIQMDRFRPGLMAASLDRDRHGNLIRLSGIMAVVEAGGVVRPGDGVTLTLPPPPHQPLEPV